MKNGEDGIEVIRLNLHSKDLRHRLILNAFNSVIPLDGCASARGQRQQIGQLAIQILYDAIRNDFDSINLLLGRDLEPVPAAKQSKRLKDSASANVPARARPVSSTATVQNSIRSPNTVVKHVEDEKSSPTLAAITLADTAPTTSTHLIDDEVSLEDLDPSDLFGDMFSSPKPV